MKDKEYYESVNRIHTEEGRAAYHLDVFGDYIAEREGFKANHGIEAIHLYLVHKFGWTPATVKAMSYNDIRFVLSEEISGWRLPKEAIL